MTRLDRFAAPFKELTNTLFGHGCSSVRGASEIMECNHSQSLAYAMSAPMSKLR